MTKAELIDKLSQSAQLTKAQTAAVVNDLLHLITTEAAAGNKITFTGFGSFAPKQRKARIGRNPRTGAEIDIPATTTLSFTPGKELKSALN